MWAYAVHNRPHHKAVSRLQVPVRVLYLDRSGSAMAAGVADSEGSAVNHHDFVPEQLQSRALPGPPRVNVLYRPGHYDIIYPR